MDDSTMAAHGGHRWFAAIYDAAMARTERQLLAPLRTWIAGGASGRVLEVGAGTGANLPFYPPGVELTAVEPDPHMLRRARRRAERLGRPVDLLRAPAEALPFPDGAFDAVVVTLVLCTVTDPARSLAEIRRVLRPGGELRFVEHVRGHGVAGRFHDLAAPLWRLAAAGCHPNRRTLDAVAVAGFTVRELRESQLAPGTPLVAGVAAAGAATVAAHPAHG